MSVWKGRTKAGDNENSVFQCTRTVFMFVAKKQNSFVMDHHNLTKTSGHLFPSGPFFFFLYLALHILGLAKVKQVLAKKTSEKGLMVWGSAKRTLSKLFHTDPQVPEISSKREKPPMRQEIQSFSGWLKSSYQGLRVHHDLKWIKWNSLIHSYWNITCSFSSRLGDLKYDNYFQLLPFSEILCT